MKMSSQLHGPADLSPEKEHPWYLLDCRLGGPQSQSVCCGVEKYHLPCRESNPSPQSVAILTELSRIIYRPSLSKEPNRAGPSHPFTWGRRQIRFLKSSVPYNTGRRTQSKNSLQYVQRFSSCCTDEQRDGRREEAILICSPQRFERA
jgi:hypothetical protein